MCYLSGIWSAKTACTTVWQYYGECLEDGGADAVAFLSESFNDLKTWANTAQLTESATQAAEALGVVHYP
jgi:hypothetical protein